MSTVYTVNGKVLKNSANDKWLAKKEAPAGFVMNASNATYTTAGGNVFVLWQAPTYPNAYNGDGKQYTLVNNNSTLPSTSEIVVPSNFPLMYVPDSDIQGPEAIYGVNMWVLGTNTGVLLNNPASSGGYGTRLSWMMPFGMTLEQAQAYMANVSITIVDP